MKVGLYNLVLAAEDIVKKFADSINGHDIEALAALWAHDAVFHDPSTAEPIMGKDAIKPNLNNWLTASPDLAFQPPTSCPEATPSLLFKFLIALHSIFPLPPCGRAGQLRAELDLMFLA